jgi:hypothetical protein
MICKFVIWRDILELQNLVQFCSYESGPKMIEFTSLYVLCFGSTCTAHLQSNFAQIWCAFILRAYLEITEKMFIQKMDRNVRPENAPSLRFQKYWIFHGCIEWGVKLWADADIKESTTTRKESGISVHFISSEEFKFAFKRSEPKT